ncbi:MAG: DUF2178 domain-containing protein [Oscillospiraceae bacterium]|nr:DUF2178 domain-containing protein [Oscillospiraceae bacterium]
MDFKKRLKQRFLTAVSYIVIGLILLLSACLTNFENHFLTAYGIALVLMGILRLIRHRKITASEQTIRRQELAETDERTRMIAERARSWAFSLTILLAGIAVIVLSLLGRHEEALPFSWLVCGMVVLYWLCWYFVQKKY